MSFALVQTVASGSPALATDEAKAHLSIPAAVTDDNTDVARAVLEAQADAERECGRSFGPSTWLLVLDDFPGICEPIRIPLPPCRGVNSVKYYDTSGVQQTLSTDVYFAATRGEPARLALKDNQVWPQVQTNRPEAVEIEFLAGWVTVAAVPADLKAAVKLILGDRWMNRGDETKAASKAIPDGAMRILTAWRAHEVG